jgi:hypothetical protein
MTRCRSQHSFPVTQVAFVAQVSNLCAFCAFVAQVVNL